MTDILLFGGYKRRSSFRSLSLVNQRWTRMRDLPSERSDHGSVTIGQNAFVFGGYHNKNIDRYDKYTNTFQTVNTMNEFRCEFGICTIKGKVLISGGRDEKGLKLKSCSLFYPISNIFLPKANMKVKRSGHALVNINDKFVFSIGGYNDQDSFLNSIEKYDPETDVWTIVDLKLNIARENHQAVAYNHCIYVFGGSTRNNVNASDTIEKINTATETTILIKTRLKVARESFALAKVDNNAYILGGFTSNSVATDTVEIFNIENETITSGINVPFADYNISACVL